MDPHEKEISDSLQLAIDAEDANRIHAARELYSRCLALEGNSKNRVDPTAWANVRRRAWVFAAWFRREQGDLRVALGLLRRASRRWPRAESVHSQMARCLLDLGCFTLAEREFRNALAIHPLPTTWSFLACTLRRQGHEDESAECLHEVLALDPNYEEAHFNLGVHHRGRDEYAEAIDHFERAIAIDPDYGIAHRELGYTLLLDRRDGSVPRAVRERAIDVEARFRKAIALEPDDEDVRYYYGKHLLRAKRYTEARAQLVLADALGHPRALEVLHAAE